MRKENVKVIIWGLGSMGKGMAEMLLKKKGVEIVGVVGRGEKLGKSMYDFLGIQKEDKNDCFIGTYDDVIKEKSADVVLR